MSLSPSSHPASAVRRGFTVFCFGLVATVACWAAEPAVADAAPQVGRAWIPITFPAGKIGQREPLVVSGSGQDVLYVWYSGPDEIRLGFHHVGGGGPVSAPFRVERGRTYELELNLGCFYPANAEGAFAGWPPDRQAAMRHRLFASLDRTVLLSASVDFFPTHPADIHFGENPGPYVATGKFSGRLGPVRHQGIGPRTPPLPANPGPLRLTVRFPADPPVGSEPLVSAGKPGAGEMLYVSYVSPGRLRLGHDSWGAGKLESVLLPFEPDLAQTVEVELPSLVTPPAVGQQSRLMVRYNGAMVLVQERPAPPGGRDHWGFARNEINSTVTSGDFSGEIDAVEVVPSLSMSASKFQQGTGPARLVVRFPTDAMGKYEPLLVTGHREAGDILFVHYKDDGHIQIGYDHWSAGGPLSAPIPVDYAAVHVLEVRHAGLLPAENDPAWNGVPAAVRQAALNTLEVLLNGRVVLSHPVRAYPSAPEEIMVGLNGIGATTCGPTFTGSILPQERTGLPTAAAAESR